MVVENCDGLDAGENEVLGDLGCEAAEVDEEDVCVADLFLGLDSPEANLAIVEGDLIW